MGGASLRSVHKVYLVLSVPIHLYKFWSLRDEYEVVQCKFPIWGHSGLPPFEGPDGSCWVALLDHHIRVHFCGAVAKMRKFYFALPTALMQETWSDFSGRLGHIRLIYCPYGTPYSNTLGPPCDEQSGLETHASPSGVIPANFWKPCLVWTMRLKSWTSLFLRSLVTVEIFHVWGNLVLVASSF